VYKRVKMNPIEFVGTELLGEKDRETANTLLNEYYPKIKRMLKNEISLRVHLKEANVMGKKIRYTLNAKVIAPTQILETSATDWDLARTIHKAMEKIETEIEHKFKVSEQK
jgi:ribosome-associated translation inhibitor RaiA